MEADTMKVVILAHANDNHTAPLKWALEQAGYTVECWSGLGWNEEQQATIRFDGSTVLTLGRYSLQRDDVVWIRRPNPPVHNPQVAEVDRKFAEGEYRWFSWSLLYLLGTLPVRCINPYSASRFINNKSVQLVLARQSGMNVPETLMSNSPAAVKSFLEQREGSRTICKAFFPHVWQKGSGGIAVTETFEIKRDQLPADEVLTYAPAIYQEMVVKQYDVRTVLLGPTVYSYSLHNPKGALDWRQDAGQGLVEVRSIETPPEVEKAVLSFAQKAGISFGSLDFAIDAEGRWWFLEINEEGQFLWLDEFNSGLGVQQKFLAFLTSPAGAPREVIEERQSLFPSWRDFQTSPAKDEVPPEVAAGPVPFVSIEP
jgi:glutathione synthase/RimK-type ligase-like ATP-grasp enzyme